MLRWVHYPVGQHIIASVRAKQMLQNGKDIPSLYQLLWGILPAMFELKLKAFLVSSSPSEKFNSTQD